MSGFSNFMNNFFRFERDRSGNISYFLDGDGFKNSSEYLQMSFDNPVLSTIITLRSKIFCQMKISHLDSSGNEIKNSEVLKLLQNPNYFQTQEDFLFQLMWFQSAVGTNITYCKKAFKNSLPKAMYNLIPSEINLNNTQKIKHFFWEKSDIKDFENQKIIYKLDGQEHSFLISDLIPFYDLANGLKKNSFMQSPSRVKSISKTLENIEQNMYSKNMNLQFSQKYLATASGNMGGVTPQMQPEDRTAIERILLKKSIHITKNQVDVKHLVSDFKKLFLDEMFSNDALTCLLAFEMNRDMLNYFSNGASTHENQQQGLLSYLQNSVQVDANAYVNSISQSFGLFEIGHKLVASYDHLPIMQTVLNTKIDTLRKFVEVIEKELSLSIITVNEAKEKIKNIKLNLGL